MLKEVLTYFIATQPIIFIALAYLVPWNPVYAHEIQRIAVSSIFWLWPVLLVGYGVLIREKSKGKSIPINENNQVKLESPEFSLINQENILIIYWVVQIIFPYFPILGEGIQWILMFYTCFYGYRILSIFIYLYKNREKAVEISTYNKNLIFYGVYSICLLFLPLLSIYRLSIFYIYPMLFMFLVGPCTVFFIMGWTVLYSIYPDDSKVVYSRFISIGYFIILLNILIDVNLSNELFFNLSLFLNNFPIWYQLFIINSIIIMLYGLFSNNLSLVKSYIIWALSYFNIILFFIVYLSSETLIAFSDKSVAYLLWLVAIMIPNTLNLAQMNGN